MTGALPSKVILAAGGTGGHMFPAQALARELIGRGVTVVLFTDRRGGGFGPELPQVETHRISATGIAGRSPLRKLASLLRLGLGLYQAYRLIKAGDGDVVVGFGGYASVPAAIAGSRLGLRVVLHEQNAVLGRANRLLAGRADAIATCFERVDAIPEADRGKVAVTGNPVRPAVAALAHRPYPVPGEGDRLRLLVIGGSLGASVFDELVPAALCRLPAELRGRISVTQQVRGAGSEAIAARYAEAGIACDLARFFDDLPQRLGAAHLVICRAGASTVAELAVAGRPSLLVPYPTATDDHQSANAERLAAAGAGWVVPQDALDADKLAERLSELLGNPGLLARAARCAAACGRHEAARALADLVCDLRGSNGDDASGSGEEAA